MDETGEEMERELGKMQPSKTFKDERTEERKRQKEKYVKKQKIKGR